ncbi:helix-turn-helix domain-containing protein [Luedemannella flava]
MILLRRVIGDALRGRRLRQQRTLREVSTAANVSLGYLSEIERGHKEASSELLASICDALGAQLSEVLREASDTLAIAEQVNEVLAPTADGGLTDGDVTVEVRHEGPLRTTLGPPATAGRSRRPRGDRSRSSSDFARAARDGCGIRLRICIDRW